MPREIHYGINVNLINAQNRTTQHNINIFNNINIFPKGSYKFYLETFIGSGKIKYNRYLHHFRDQSNFEYLRNSSIIFSIFNSNSFFCMIELFWHITFKYFNISSL